MKIGKKRKNIRNFKLTSLIKYYSFNIYFKRKNQSKITYLVLLAIGLTLAIGYSGSTYLLGAFIAGMGFSEVKSIKINNFN